MEKLKKFIASKNFTVALSFLGLYLLSTGISLAVFTLVGGDPKIVTTGELSDTRSKIASLPKTQECPINGKMFTEIEKDIWEERRPITAMIENHHESRPPSGLSRADVVYEAVAEGGVTRFLGVFYCGVSAEDVHIAPVRSARVYFIDWASEYADYPIFMHVGGANDFSGFGETIKAAQALEKLSDIGWRVPRGNDFDTIYDSGFPVFWRDYERLGHEIATEHTMTASLDAAFTEAERREFGAESEYGLWDQNYKPWEFVDEKPGGEVSEISFKFWDERPDYDVSWKYDSATNAYLRFNGGEEHMDMFDDTQLSTKNLVIMFTKERGPVDANGHMLYTTIGSGKALIFTNGNVSEGSWSKKTRIGRTIFEDENGDEFEFTRGNVWVEVLPSGNKVDY